MNEKKLTKTKKQNNDNTKHQQKKSTKNGEKKRAKRNIIEYVVYSLFDTTTYSWSTRHNFSLITGSFYLFFSLPRTVRTHYHNIIFCHRQNNWIIAQNFHTCKSSQNLLFVFFVTVKVIVQNTINCNCPNRMKKQWKFFSFHISCA